MKKSIITTLSILLFSTNLYAKEPKNIILCAEPTYVEIVFSTYKKYGADFFDNMSKYTENRCMGVPSFDENKLLIKVMASEIIKGEKHCTIDIFFPKTMETIVGYTKNTKEAPVCDYFKK